MDTVVNSNAQSGRSGRLPLGGFLDELPVALYVIAHLVFLAAGVWMWMRASDQSLPYSGALALYVLSQLGFIAYFAHGITMKMAVLAEQSLVFAMLMLIVIRAS